MSATPTESQPSERCASRGGGDESIIAPPHRRRDAPPYVRSIGSGRATPLLRTFVTQRGAGLQTRAAFAAQAEDAYTIRRHFPMDGRIVVREIEIRRAGEGRRLATRLPRTEARHHLTEELHGRLPKYLHDSLGETAGS